MTREQIRCRVIDLALHHNNIALQYATGLGKTYLSLNVIAEWGIIENRPLKVLLLIAEKAHKKNWEDEFKKWNFNASRFTIECYASLKKYNSTEWDVIILDEAHRAGSDIRLDLFNSIKTKKLILLSATLPDSILENLSNIYGKIKTDKIDLNKAIKWGILPKPVIYLIPLHLRTDTPSETIIEERGKVALRKTIKCTLQDRWTYLKNKIAYPNLRLEIKCTEKEKYDYLSQNFEYWKKQFFRDRQERTKVKWLQIGAQRKRFLGECKTSHVSTLLKYINPKYRYICFCSGIEQADFLGSTNAIHSKNSSSLVVIDKFNNKKINSLFAVSMAQEGLNLVDIEAGIIVQLDGYERGWIQKIGRVLRAKEPLQFIFYYKETKDMDYLENVLEGVNEEYITEVNNILNLKI